MRKNYDTVKRCEVCGINSNFTFTVLNTTICLSCVEESDTISLNKSQIPKRLKTLIEGLDFREFNRTLSTEQQLALSVVEYYITNYLLEGLDYCYEDFMFVRYFEVYKLEFIKDFIDFYVGNDNGEYTIATLFTTIEPYFKDKEFI